MIKAFPVKKERKISQERVREEHTNRPKVFKNRELRRIFGTKSDKMLRGWRNLRNEELHNLCSSLNMIRMIASMRMTCTDM
jgi:hypothetical protein